MGAESTAVEKDKVMVISNRCCAYPLYQVG